MFKIINFFKFFFIKKNILVALLLSTTLSIIAQETAPSTDGDTSRVPEVPSSFTVGQVFYTTTHQVQVLFHKECSKRLKFKP